MSDKIVATFAEMKFIRSKRKIALFSACLFFLIIVYGFLFHRDDVIQISRISGHKRHIVRVFNVTIYTENFDTELSELVHRRDRVDAWEISSAIRHRFGGTQTDCMAWARIEVEIYVLISKWQEEGVKLSEQRRMARAYLDESPPQIPTAEVLRTTLTLHCISKL